MLTLLPTWLCSLSCLAETVLFSVHYTFFCLFVCLGIFSCSFAFTSAALLISDFHNKCNQALLKFEVSLKRQLLFCIYFLEYIDCENRATLKLSNKLNEIKFWCLMKEYLPHRSYEGGWEQSLHWNKCKHSFLFSEAKAAVLQTDSWAHHQVQSSVLGTGKVIRKAAVIFASLAPCCLRICLFLNRPCLRGPVRKWKRWILYTWLYPAQE